MKRLIFNNAVLLRLSCVLTLIFGAVYTFAKSENHFSSKMSVSSGCISTGGINKYESRQMEIFVLNHQASNIEFSGFDAISWFDLLKKTFGIRISGQIHGKITKTALKALQIKGDIIEKVIKANWHTDWKEYKKTLPPVPNDKYNPAHHFGPHSWCHVF